MKLGCFQSNQGLHQLSFHDFIVQAAQLGYEAIDIPLNVPDAAAAVRQLGMQVNSVGALVLSELSTLETRLEGMARRGHRRHRQRGTAAGAHHHHAGRPCPGP